MKAKAEEVRRLLDRWNPDLRLVLLFGADESASREMAQQLAARLSDPSDPMSVTGFTPQALAEDPARLADEAAAVSMFGGARVIRLDGANDQCLEAVELLLSAPAAGNPVIATAGSLRKDNKLRALAEGAPQALAVESFAPTERDAGSTAGSRARDLGLKPTPRALKLLLAATNSDRALLARELEKFALWLDADPANPKTLDVDHLAALGADNGESEVNAFVSALLSGDRAGVDRQLALLQHEGISAIPVLRALGRKLMQLIELAAMVEAGVSPTDAVKGARPPIFWKEQDAVIAQLQRWRSADLAAALDRCLALERVIKMPNSPGDIAAWQGMLEVGQRAR